ncbi:far upstream element-binding protein 3-like [Bolinopsis microptera]|uniref:far upstream element-binding protein 3-like n=1 Tax=Bolinopsis microptera TaxID=2820187 RepID=UPI00307B090D
MSSPHPNSAILRRLREKQQTQQTRIHVEPTEVFEIPEDKCGLVIGKRGCKIQKIRSEAGVGVNLWDRNSAVDGMMKVYLWGDKKGCDKAKKIIMNLISESTEVFEIPEDMSGIVIGKGGSKVKQIRSETGVRVSLGSRDSALNSMIKVTLMGNKEGCDEAKTIIMNLISVVIKVFEIHKVMSGVLIGKGGSKVKQIQSETGVTVSVGSRDSAVGGMIKVTLIGNKEGCDKAKKVIMDIISEPTEVFEIHKDMSGIVIGKGGSKVKQIQSENRSNN